MEDDGAGRGSFYKSQNARPATPLQAAAVMLNHQATRETSCPPIAIQSMLPLSRIILVVIASKKTKRSRLGDCGCSFVRIASLSLAMTIGIAPT